jgi:hypothetical protein
METRVLPVPVAMTRRLLRRIPMKALQQAVIASFW